MRNLKKVLSLALALVMLVGMMVIGAGATEYKDDASIKNKEAVEVMSALKILEGDKGKFDPKGTLTRGQATKIIAYLDLGPAAANLRATDDTFVDVKPSRYYAPFVAYCYQMGIVEGSGNKFNPEGTVTGYQFAKMVLVAMGKDAEESGYNGNGTAWRTNVAKDLRLLGMPAVTNKPISRDDAAQLAFAGLTTPVTGETGYALYVSSASDAALVDAYKNVTFSSVTDAVLAKLASGDDAKAWSVKPVAPTNTLGFTSYGLKQDTVTDDFGHITNVWAANGNVQVKLGTVDPIKVYTSKVTAATAAADLKGYKITDDQAKEIETKSGNGKLVEVYSADGKVGTVKDFTYTVGELKVSTATNGDVTYTVGARSGKDFAGDKTDTVKLEGSVAKDDIVTAVMGDKILHIYPTTQIVGTMSSYAPTTKTVTVSGSTYTVGTDVTDIDVKLTNNSLLGAPNYTYYLDQFGFVVAAKAPEGEAKGPVNYAYIQAGSGAVTPGDALTDSQATANAKVRAVLADGSTALYDLAITVKKVGEGAAAKNYFYCGDIKISEKEVDAKTDAASTTDLTTWLTSVAGKVWGYTLKDGKMTLEAVTATSAAALDTTKTYVDSLKSESAYGGGNTLTVGASGKSALVTASTVFVVIKLDGSKTEAKTYTGSLLLNADATLETGMTWVVMKAASTTAGTAAVVFTTDDGKIATTDSSIAGYAYVDGSSKVTALGSKTGEYVHTFDAVTASGAVKLTKTTESAADTVTDGVYAYNKKNEIGDPETGAKNVTVLGGNITKTKTGETGWLTLTSKTQYVSLDSDIAANAEGANGNVCIVIAGQGAESATAAWVFILEAATIDNVPANETEEVAAGTNKVIANGVAGTLEVAGTVTVENGVTGKVEAKTGSDVTIEGEVAGTVEAKSGSNVTIEGNVSKNAEITANPGSTVAITGEVAKGATINAPAGATVTINGEVFNGTLKVNAIGGAAESRAAAGITITADIGSDAVITAEAGTLTINGTIKKGAQVTLSAGITKFEAEDFEEAVKLVKSGTTKWKSTGDASTKGVRGTLGDGVYVTDKANYVNGGNEGKTYDYLVVISGVTKTVDHYDETWELTYEGGTAVANATWPESGSNGNLNPGQQTLVNHFYDKKDPIGSNTVQESWDPEAAVTESGYIHYTCVVTFTDNTTKTVEYDYSYAGAAADET